MDEKCFQELKARVESLEKEVMPLKKRRRQAAAWNRNKTNSVVLSKLKEFSIQQGTGFDIGCWSVRGWFNRENFFSFGWFDSEEEAKVFLEEIHNML